MHTQIEVTTEHLEQNHLLVQDNQPILTVLERLIQGSPRMTSETQALDPMHLTQFQVTMTEKHQDLE